MRVYLHSIQLVSETWLSIDQHKLQVKKNLTKYIQKKV